MEKITQLAAHERLLTPAELRVFKYLGLGKSRKEIAETLRISTKTISTHRNNICQKMGFKDNNEMIFYYVFYQIRTYLNEQGYKIPDHLELK